MDAYIIPHLGVESKNELRARLLEARVLAACGPGRQKAIHYRLQDALKHYKPTCVGFYWSLQGEPDVHDTIAAWLSLNEHHKAALPVIRDRNAPLEFHIWTPNTPMRQGYYTITEPISECTIILDLLFVPCIGFDNDGYRLGYGYGYYDRTLATWSTAARPIMIGVTYEFCRIPILKHEAHDIPLDVIITDEACYLINSKQ